MVAPSAPAALAPYPISRRRVVLPLNQPSCAHFSSFHLSDIASPPLLFAGRKLAAPMITHALERISFVSADTCVTGMRIAAAAPLLVTDRFSAARGGSSVPNVV